jgi:hypothetical protein
VEWYPWGEEAFAAARAQHKPIFLSVGYATCHWCHVMEGESFESEETVRGVCVRRMRARARAAPRRLGVLLRTHDTF